MITQDEIREILKKSGFEANPSNRDFTKSFADIGLDSLDVYSFLTEVEIVLGKSFSEQEYGNLKTLEDLMNILNK